MRRTVLDTGAQQRELFTVYRYGVRLSVSANFFTLLFLLLKRNQRQKAREFRKLKAKKQSEYCLTADT